MICDVNGKRFDFSALLVQPAGLVFVVHFVGVFCGVMYCVGLSLTCVKKMFT
jgi:hypothetical protein